MSELTHKEVCARGGKKTIEKYPIEVRSKWSRKAWDMLTAKQQKEKMQKMRDSRKTAKQSRGALSTGTA